MNKNEKIFTYTFISLLTIFFLLGLHSFLNKFEENIEKYEYTENSLKIISNNLNNFRNSLTNVEVFQNSFIDIYGITQKMLNNNYIHDAIPSLSVVKQKDGMTTFINDEFDPSEYADNLLALNETLKDKNIPILYLQAPYKIDEKNSKMPVSIHDYSNQNTNQFLEIIKEKDNIEIIDFRDYFKEKELKDIFYKTDHHWKSETGFKAFQKIANVLNENYNFEIPKKVTDKKNYNYKTYEKIFLGSSARRVGRFYIGLDDFTLITPKFKTDFKFHVIDDNSVKTGNFKTALIDFTKINRQDVYGINSFTSYMGSDWTESVIYNNKTNSNKKILIVKDSFHFVVSPFLATGVKEIHMVDLRYIKNKTLIDKIDEVNPDILMFLYNPSIYNAGQANAFTFYKNIN